ncbi:RNA polymerase sigma factor FliA [Kistimonas scapharcae]|uniref:RNA polymerase sigma factor n=1 Tax=Kistimonas scapharcae TaxID=1036133 RepID=A0ABP8V2C1_9GAMM
MSRDDGEPPMKAEDQSEAVNKYRNIQESGVNALVRKHMGLVRKIAYHLAGSLGHSTPVEDLIQSGVVGLLEAAGRYDQSTNVAFEYFARPRIRGAMVDLVREGDWRPRRIREESQKITRAIAAVEARLGRPATDRDIAEELEMELQDYQHMLMNTHGARLLSLESLEESSEPGREDTPVDVDFLKASCGKALADAIGQMPEREQQLLNLYYVHEMNMKEIALILGITESRVCQLHRQGVLKLRSYMESWRST